jgi:hypothetical protein
VSQSNTAAQVIPSLEVSKITDKYVQKNFKNLNDFFQAQNQLINFNFFDLTFTSTVSAQLFSHNLGYLPLDILMMKISGSGIVQFNMGAFTTTKMSITVTGTVTASSPTRIRFFIGSYWNQQNPTAPASTDVMQFQSLIQTFTPSKPNTFRFIQPGTYQYIPTKGILYAKVLVVGGGASGNTGSVNKAGTASTFGSYVTANGGSVNTGAGYVTIGPGGTVVVNIPAPSTGVTIQTLKSQQGGPGNYGSTGSVYSASVAFAGGTGGINWLGNTGTGGVTLNPAVAAGVSAPGSGAGGGGCGSQSTNASGTGGSAGGAWEGMVFGLTSSMVINCLVGAGGQAQASTANSGACGQVLIREFFQ